MGHDGSVPMAGCGQGAGRTASAPCWLCCPQPASATHRAPAAASARCREGSASASPTSSAAAATTVPPAAMALGPWAAAVSSRICACQASLSLLSVCPRSCQRPICCLSDRSLVCPSVHLFISALLSCSPWVGSQFPFSPSAFPSIHPFAQTPCSCLAWALPCLALTHLSIRLSVCPQEPSCAVACGLGMPWVLVPHLSVCLCVAVALCLTRAVPSRSLCLLPGGLGVPAV